MSEIRSNEQRPLDLEPQPPALKPPWGRALLLLVFIGLLLSIVYVSPLKPYLSQVRELSLTIQSFGAWGPIVLSSGVAVLVAVGFPRLLFCVIAGMALGFWQGLLWTQLGTLAGNYILFMIARRAGGDWVRHYVLKRAAISSFLRDEGMSGVILARQLPVPGLVINLGLGLVSIRHRDFLLGTLIGQLPQAIPFTLIGAGALKGSFATSAGLMGLAVALAVLAWMVSKRLIRARKKETSNEPG